MTGRRVPVGVANTCSVGHLRTMAGARSCAYAPRRSPTCLFGTGKKLPKRASSRSPSSCSIVLNDNFAWLLRSTTHLRDRRVNRYEFRAVGERALDLHLSNQILYPRNHLVQSEEATAKLHELGDRLALPDELQRHSADEGTAFGHVQAHTHSEPALRKHASLVQAKVIPFARRQLHRQIRLPRTLHRRAKSCVVR